MKQNITKDNIQDSINQVAFSKEELAHKLEAIGVDTVEELQELLDEAKTSYNTMVANNKSNTGRARRLKEDIDSYQSTISHADNIQKLQAAVDAFQAQMDSLDAVAAASPEQQAQLEGLQKALSDVQAEITEKQVALIELLEAQGFESIQDLEDELGDIQSKLSKLEDRNRGDSTRADRLRREIGLYEGILLADKKKTDLIAEAERIEVDIQALEEEIAAGTVTSQRDNEALEAIDIDIAAVSEQLNAALDSEGYDSLEEVKAELATAIEKRETLEASGTLETRRGVRVIENIALLEGMIAHASRLESLQASRQRLVEQEEGVAGPSNSEREAGNESSDVVSTHSDAPAGVDLADQQPELDNDVDEGSVSEDDLQAMIDSPDAMAESAQTVREDDVEREEVSSNSDIISASEGQADSDLVADVVASIDAGESPSEDSQSSTTLVEGEARPNGSMSAASTYQDANTSIQTKTMADTSFYTAQEPVEMVIQQLVSSGPLLESFLDTSLINALLSDSDNMDPKARSLLTRLDNILTEMPEGAEKTLIALLIHVDFEERKEYLEAEQIIEGSLMTSESMIDVLSLLKAQLSNENLLDNRTREYFNELESMLEEESIDYFKFYSPVFELLSEIRPLNIPLTLELIRDALDAATIIEGKDVIQLLGGTGTGKSTTIHFLAGSTLEKTHVEGIAHIAPVAVRIPEVESFVTSPFAESETRIINAITYSLRDIDDTVEGEVTLCDSPGFDDTGGAEIDIANGIGVVRALKGANTVRPVILVSSDSIGARFEGLVRLVRILSSMIPNLSEELDAFSYVFTKFDKSDEKTVLSKLKNKKRSLNPEEKANKAFVAVFDDMISKSQESMFILDPINDSPIDVLNLLQNSDPIVNPKEKFKDFATPASMAKLKEQLYKHKLSIEKALERVDVPVVVFKLQQLADLNEVISLYESQRYYDLCLEGTRELIERLIINIQKRLEVTIHASKSQDQSEIIECIVKMRDLMLLEPVRVQHLPEFSDLSAFVMTQIVRVQVALNKAINERIEATHKDSDFVVGFLGTEALSALDKMRVMQNGLIELFGKIEGCEGLITRCQVLYDEACTAYFNRFDEIFESLNKSIQDQEYSQLVHCMNLLLQSKRYFIGHFAGMDFEKYYNQAITAISDITEQASSLAAEFVESVNEELSEDAVQAMVNSAAAIDRLSSTVGIETHFDQERIESALESVKYLFSEGMAKLTESLQQVWGTDRSAFFGELSKRLKLVKQLRSSPAVAYMIRKNYQAFIDQVKSNIISLKSNVLVNMTPLSKNPIASIKDVRLDEMVVSLALLRDAQIVEDYFEGAYAAYWEEIQALYDELIITLEDQVRKNQSNIEGIDSTLEVIQLTKITYQCSSIDELFFDLNKSMMSLNEEVSLIWEVIFEQISMHSSTISVEKIEFSNIKNLMVIFSAMSSGMPEVMLSSIQEAETIFNENLNATVTALMEKLSVEAPQLLNVTPTRDASIDSAKIAQALVFVRELHHYLDENVNLQVKIDVTSSVKDFYNKWFAAQEEGLSGVETYLAALYDLVQTLEGGEMPDGIYDVVEIAASFKVLDVMFSGNQTFTEVSARLESVLKSFDQTLSNELKLLASTGDYSEFKQRYEQSLSTNPDLSTKLSEVLDYAFDRVFKEMNALITRLSGLQDIRLESIETFRSILGAYDTVMNFKVNIGSLIENMDIAFHDKIDQVGSDLSEKIARLCEECGALLTKQNYARYSETARVIGALLLTLELTEHTQSLVSGLQEMVSASDQSIKQALEKDIELYAEMSFDKYSEFPPRLIVENLEKVSENQPGFSEAISKISASIQKKIEVVISALNANIDDSDAQVEFQLIQSAMSAIPEQVKSHVASSIADLAEKIEQKNLIFQRELEEDASAGHLKQLVDMLVIAKDAKNYKRALNVSNAIRGAISSAQSRFENDLSKGDIASVLVNLPKSWEDWWYFINEQIRIQKKIPAKYRYIFEVESLIKKVNAMLSSVSKGVDDFCREVISVTQAGTIDYGNLRNFEKYIKTATAMAKLYQNYQEVVQDHGDKAPHFYTDIVNKDSELKESYPKAMTQVLSYFTRIQKIFETGLMSDNLSCLCPLLDAYSERPILVQSVLDFMALPGVQGLLKGKDELPQHLDSYTAMKSRLAERIIEISTELFEGIVHNSKYKTHDKLKLENLYQSLSMGYSVIKKSFLLASHVDIAVADVRSIDQEVKAHYSTEIDKLEAEILQLIDEMPSENGEVYDEFNIWLSNLDVIIANFDDPAIAQLATAKLKSVQRALQEAAHAACDKAVQLNQIDDLSDSFVRLKHMSLSVNHFMKLINQEIDRALIQFSRKDGGGQRVAMLGLSLRNTEGEYQDAAIRLINEHAVFEGYSVTIRNEKTLRYTPDQVIRDISGTNINTDVLSNAIERHNELYWPLVESGLMQSAQVCESIRKEVSEISKAGLNADTMIELSARLFAYWTLINSERYIENMDLSSTEDSRTYLLQPHAAQVLSIFRLLGIDLPKDELQNHLVQIGTGEGKSVTLAISATLLALCGYEVDCVCYSQYLSDRDYRAFSYMFEAFNVKSYIQYGTFHTLSNRLIDRKGDVRKLVKHAISPFQEVSIIDTSSDREKILLMDEVDVFFSKDVYAKAFRPCARITWKSAAQLVLDIYEAYAPNGEVPSLSDIQSFKSYLSCVVDFGEYDFLVESAVCEMISDLRDLESHQYIITQDKIGYKLHDGVTTSLTKAYSTIFTYIKEFRLGNISKASMESRCGILVDCGLYSYAEIPKQYRYILGTSGTLNTLSDAENKIIRDYGIETFTYMPSVYGKNQLEFAKDSIRDMKIVPEDGYFTEISREIQARMGSNAIERPVLVFFEDRAVLEKFYESSALESTGFKERVRLITELLSGDEKDSLVAQACGAGHLTLLTKEFGRGTDFKSYDDRVNELGGVHVIQTFVSLSLSEETQIIGRTARQGNKGSYSLVLNDKHLHQLGMNEDVIKSMRDSGKLYQTMHEYRTCHYDKILPTYFNDVESKRNKHERFMRFINDGLYPNNKEIIKNHLKERVVLQVPQVSSNKTANAVILLDATGSMGLVIDQCKSTLKDVIFRAVEVMRGEGYTEQVKLRVICYRSYDQNINGIMVDSGWSSLAEPLINFLTSVYAIGGTWPGEAIEVGLSQVNRIHQDETPVDQIILLGDAPSNSPEKIADLREKYQGEDHWRQYELTRQPTDLLMEARTAEKNGIIINAFYVSDNDLSDIPPDSECYKKIADSTGGQSGVLNINSQSASEQLVSIITERILDNVGGNSLVQTYRERYGMVSTGDFVQKSGLFSGSASKSSEEGDESHKAGPSRK